MGDRGLDGASSIQVTRRHDRSTFMFITQHLIKPFKKYTVELPVDRGSKGSPTITPPRYVTKHCFVTNRIIEDIHVCDLTNKSGGTTNHTTPESKSKVKRVYYFAGGGWQSPPNATHWTFLITLAKRTPDAIFSVVGYPLAPTTSAPRALPQLLRFYQTALREAQANGETVILVGDSAGANIALCLPLTALSEDPEALCPSAILAISPSTDLRRTNPDMDRIQSHDPVLYRSFVVSTAKDWAGTIDLGDPRVSPLLADVTHLARRGVEVHGVTGGYDILGPDAVLMREKLDQAGVKGKWLDWDKQMHIFPLLQRFKFRESQQARDWVVEVLKECK